MIEQDDWRFCRNCRMLQPVGHSCTALLDPTAPLVDYFFEFRSLAWTHRLEQPQLGCPCSGTGWLGREWLERREPQCTCGGGDPEDYTTFHDVSCDSVPCPFCPPEEPR